MTDKSEQIKPEPKPKPKPEPKPKAVTVVHPDGREYRTTEAEAARLVRTAGYTRLN